MSTNFGATQRSIANRALTKIVPIGLGGSILLHTIAIAGVSYWAQNRPDEELQILEIERVEVARPVPTPSTKPILTPEPKVVNPPVIASIPKPIPVKVLTPQPRSTPIPVVKITKSAATKPSISPLADIAPPRSNRVDLPVKVAAVNPQKPNPTPSFPDKLFRDPLPKNTLFKPAIETQTPKILPQQTKIATRKIQSKLTPNVPNKNFQSTTAGKKTASDPNDKPTRSAPNPISDPTANPPTTEQSTPILPDDTSKSAQPIDRPQSPPKLPIDIGSLPLPEPLTQQPPPQQKTEPNTPTPKDRLIRSPKNNPQTPTPATSNNQVNLGRNPLKRSELDTNVGNRNDKDPIERGSRNNDRVVQSNGGNNSIKQADRPSLGGDNRQGSSNGSSSIGNGNSNSGSSNKPSAGIHGNNASGSTDRASIQCLRNCEISYPDELENSDIGKDKILVKVTIDPNGIITNAEIARSSGNQHLDRVTLAGVKQMQLTATGKTRTYRIKVSTLLR